MRCFGEPSALVDSVGVFVDGAVESVRLGNNVADVFGVFSTVSAEVGAFAFARLLDEGCALVSVETGASMVLTVSLAGALTELTEDPSSEEASGLSLVKLNILSKPIFLPGIV